jgi:tripartite-type tricarboxylate transporter receptor subunit TctC
MKKRGACKAVLLGLFAVFCFALVPVAGAQPGQFVKGKLLPLADGFPKRAINIIVIDDPGSRDDLYAKVFQQALKDASPVNILVTDEPSAVGGTWYTVQDVAKRDGGSEGYYPMIISSFGVVTDLMVDPGTKEIGAKLDQLKMVINTEIMPYVWVQRKNAPWGKSFADLMKYAKANPGKLRYISYETGSGHDIAAEWVMYTLGVKVQKIPQGTLQEACSTVGAGEGDFTVTDLATAITNMNAGRVDVIMVMGSEVPDIFKKSGAVSAKQAGLSTAITGTILGLGVPSQVPQSHIEWLTKLFDFAAKTDLYKTRLKTFPGTIMATRDGKTMDQVHRDIYKFSEPVIRAIGLHIDDQKKK